MSDPTGSHACHPANLSPEPSCVARPARITGTCSEARPCSSRSAWLRSCSPLCVGIRPDRSSTSRLRPRHRCSSDPIEWTHYQVALVPLILVPGACTSGADRGILPWVVLVLAVLTFGVVWSPSMVVADFVARLAGGTSLDASFVLMRVTAYAQLALFAVAWFVLRADEPRDRHAAAASDRDLAMSCGGRPGAAGGGGKVRRDARARCEV